MSGCVDTSQERDVRGLIVSIAAAILLMHSSASDALPPYGSAASGHDLETVYRRYFIQKSTEKGVELLAESILSRGTGYSRACLRDTVLLILKDYYINKASYQEFEDLILHVIDKDNLLLIKKYYLGTGLLTYVNNAVRRWETPFSLTIEPLRPNIGIHDSVRFNIVLRNNLGKEIEGADISYYMKPENVGVFDPGTAVFTARRTGRVSLVIRAGDAVGMAIVTVRGHAAARR